MDNTPSEYRARLEALAKTKTDEARAAAQKQADNYRQSMGEPIDLTDGTFKYHLKQAIGFLQHPSERDFCRHFCAANHFEKELRRFLQLNVCFTFDAYEPKDDANAELTDEENLLALEHYVLVGHRREHTEHAVSIRDLLFMMGKLASNIKSVFRARILQMLSDFDDFNTSPSLATGNRPDELTAEFVNCWKLLMEETRFLSSAELADALPKPPEHLKSDIQFNPSSPENAKLGAEELTAKSRDFASRIYRHNMGELVDDAKIGDIIGAPSSGIVDVADNLQKMADEVEKPLTEIANGGDIFDYQLLRKLLRTETSFYYDVYKERDDDDVDDGYYGEDGRFADDFDNEDTELNTLKHEAVRNLKRYLQSACKLAKTVDSKAYDDLALCLRLNDQYHGDFFSDYIWFEDDSEEAIAAARDLDDFIAALKRAVPQLWSDVKDYTPPKVKAQKRKPKTGREGLHGTKTAKMKEQLRALMAYIRSLPPAQQHLDRYTTLAHQFWQKNRRSFEQAKVATGENRGYQNYKTLAQSAKNTSVFKAQRY